jgi:hypothetical protein
MKWMVTIVFLFFASGFLLSQTILVGWDFEDQNSTADFGTDGTGNTPNNLGQTISPNTGATVTYETGTPGLAFTTENWAQGRFLAFTVNTSNFTGLNVTFDIRSNHNRGPRDFKLSYSTDGTTFIDAGTFTLTTNFAGKDISLPVGAAQQSTVTIRLECTSNISVNGSTIQSNRTLSIDNLQVISALDTPLPVELSSFSAVSGDGEVTLNWVTESEVNNMQFDILRALNSDGEYLMIGTVEGQFNTNQRTEYTFTDDAVANGTTYWYILADVDLNGVRTEHGPIFATPGLSDGLTPGQFKLYQNYPNPFNPSTTLQLYVPANSDKQSSVKVEIYNVVGQKVRTLFDGNLSAGVHALTWNGESDQGFAVPGGIYFAVLSAGTYTDNIKLVLLK